MKMIDYELLRGKITAMQSTNPEYAYNFLNNALNPSTEWECIEDMIDSIEVYEAEPVKRGRWLNNHAIWIEQPEIEGYFVQAECSECGRWAHEMKPYTRFLEYEKCPHCGADMREKED